MTERRVAAFRDHIDNFLATAPLGACYPSLENASEYLYSILGCSKHDAVGVWGKKN